jgi:uncharacterized protein YhfF
MGGENFAGNLRLRATFMESKTLVGQSLTEPVHAFWISFASNSISDPTSRLYEVFHFDDHESSANELGNLVIAGIKRATASLLWSYESENKPLPQPGHFSIVTNWHGEPMCVIETTEVEVVKFNEVTEEFAAIEGEGDGSLSDWMEGHTRYFGRECVRLGRLFDTDIPVICERFEVKYVNPRLPGEANDGAKPA